MNVSMYQMIKRENEKEKMLRGSTEAVTTNMLRGSIESVTTNMLRGSIEPVTTNMLRGSIEAVKNVRNLKPRCIETKPVDW